MASPVPAPGSPSNGSSQGSSQNTSASRRSRSVGTKLIDEEYTQLESLAAAQGVTPGECVRELVLAAFPRTAGGQPVAEATVAEQTVSFRSPRAEDDTHQHHLRPGQRPRDRARADAGADREGRRGQGRKSNRTSEGEHPREVSL